MNIKSKIINSIRNIKRIVINVIKIPKIWYYYITKKNVIVCIGDSHAEAFNNRNFNLAFKNTKILAYAVDGATAVGIQNPESVTNARKRFDLFLRLLPSNINIILSLGEVDCGFLIWYRNITQKLNINDQIDNTYKNYSMYINNILTRGYKNIMIYNIPMPTLNKYDSKIYKWSLRKLIHVDIEKRRTLTKKLNSKISIYCKNNGIIYLNINRLITEKSGNDVLTKYHDKILHDHHLNYDNLAPVITAELKRYGYR